MTYLRHVLWPLFVVMMGGAGWTSTKHPFCSCGDSATEGVMGAAVMTLPANAQGLIWISSIEPDSLPSPLLEMRLRVGTGLIEQHLVFERIAEDRWVVTPEGGFERDGTYILTDHARLVIVGEIPEDLEDWADVLSPTEMEVRVDGRYIEATDLSQITALVGVPRVEQVSVPAGIVCSEDVPGIVLEARARLPMELASFKEYLHYETLVDGSPFVHRRSSCDRPVRGQPSHGPARAKLFALCGEHERYLPYSSGGLDPGTHRLAFRVWLPATDIEFVTEEVEFELDTSACPD